MLYSFNLDVANFTMIESSTTNGSYIKGYKNDHFYVFNNNWKVLISNDDTMQNIYWM